MAKENVADRIDRWTQKLLDFSARNRLLNIPASSRQLLAVEVPEIARLEDSLAAAQTITVSALADLLGEQNYAELRAGKLPDERRREFLRTEMAHRRLAVDLPPRELRRRMNELYHDARTAEEESGVNPMFLSIGTLQWVEPGKGAARKSYRAPILMIPVTLERASLAEGVKLRCRDEDTVVNSTLIEFLRSQFRLEVPGIDPLPTDESGVDVPAVLAAFAQAIKKMDGWSVGEECFLGCFSFGKYVMWKDMTDRADALKQNPLVDHLMRGGGLFDDGVAIFPPGEIAAHLHPEKLFCPVSYDSSQLTAVLYSELGKTFVLHGPPGTGKSQTITNIIAHNLALGKKVLFVSEKKAALDVVKDRLDRIGLTPFCLELHSNKTEKNRFYAQLKAALEVVETGEPVERARALADLETERRRLDDYLRALHRVYPNGLSAYDCFARLLQFGDGARSELIAVDPLVETCDAHLAARRAAEELLADFRGVSAAALKAMPVLTAAQWAPAFERRLGAAAADLAAATGALLDALAAVASPLGLPAEFTFDAASSLVETLAPFRDAAKLPRPFLGGAANAVDKLRRLVKLRRARAQIAAALPGYNLAEIEKLDLDALGRRLRDNRRAFFLVRFFRNRALLKELAAIGAPADAKLTVDRLAADLPRFVDYADAGRKYRELGGAAPEDEIEIPADFRAAFVTLLDRWPEFEKRYDALLEFATDESLDDDLAALRDRCETVTEEIGELRGVMRYRHSQANAVANGVGAFAGFIFAEDDGTLDVGKVFDHAYAAKMLDAILARTKELAEFTGQGQSESVARFRALDKKLTEYAKSAIFARLAAKLPRRRQESCPAQSELGLIKRECEKKTRQKAVRQLLAETPELLPVLKPCFLMSPLSVAQYLPVDASTFDLIVFDEASQIPVWDAIGVIARGRQLIVVGDPKQMPPTNFFQKGEDVDEDAVDNGITDQESILDECLVAGVHSAYLSWHYRSRHESLIAFSNEHYYDGRLNTFPAAANSPRLGVKHHFVEGGAFIKQGGATRVNPVEAKALVDYICGEVLKSGYKPRSLGVVTFSMAQQKLIRSMLEERRAENPKLEALLSDEGEHAYFVKNLENVQGDESDVILFSIGYAPDENGRLTMNFGPLNLSGGERRLNVAVTRAKEQVVVFASIRSTQIDAGEDGRTKAVGAGHLKAFLEYAERGGAAAAADAADKASSKPSPVAGDALVESIAEFLTASGYKFARDVGCSGCRIDLAVIDPLAPDRYLLGIECDGAQYAGQLTAQDREINRVGVLNGLGWRLHRVWCVDWSLDRRHAEERLLAALDEAKASRGKSAADGAPSASAASASVLPAATPEPAAPAVSAASAPATPPRNVVYAVWKNDRVYGKERFNPQENSLGMIGRMLAEVVNEEGPVLETIARRRVAKCFGITRLTDAVNAVFDQFAPVGAVTGAGARKVLWPSGVTPAKWTGYRVAGEDADSRRAIDEIPPEEIADALREIRADIGSCAKDQLYREALRVFGAGALTAKARRFLEAAEGEQKDEA